MGTARSLVLEWVFNMALVLSLLLFIIVIQALSRVLHIGCPWELLYADDLMISAESMEELLVKVQTWKSETEKKGLVGQTKIMVIDIIWKGLSDRSR